VALRNAEARTRHGFCRAAGQIPSHLAALLSAVLGSAVAELQSSPKGKYPVLCLADEFALLGRVPIFETVFAEGRGHGFKVVPLIQNIGQLKSLYGRDSYRTFLSGSEIQIFLPPRDLETAQEISDLAGMKTVVVENKSYSKSLPTNIIQALGGGGENTGYAETGRPVLFPQEIMALQPEEFIMFAPGLMKNVYLGWRQPYWEYPDNTKLYGTNPYNPHTPPGLMVVFCPWCGAYAMQGAPSYFRSSARKGGFIQMPDNSRWGYPMP
jgi:type IV secretory pathway TraG/TraD family ATPase VirD4